MTESTTLRHDEQVDEAYYDDRSDADDDIEKGRIKFSQDKLYGRDDELSRLESIYDRVRTTNVAQIVFLPGYSGTGKSALVAEFISQMRRKSKGGRRGRISPQTKNGDSGESAAHDDNASGSSNDNVWFVSGKFEELQSADPFSAIASGLNNFCAWLHRQNQQYLEQAQQGNDDNDDDSPTKTKKNKNESKSIQKLLEALRLEFDGSDLQILGELIPNLITLIGASGVGTNDTCSIGGGRGAGDSRCSSFGTLSNGPDQKSVHRIKYLFRNLIMIFCHQQDNPLVFFIDDLQWSDAGSLDLLSVLLFDPKLQHIMFIGSYRSNEVSESHALSVFMDEVKKRRENSGGVEQMDLLDLSKEAIGDFIADTLDLEYDEVGPLADAIYSKTLGNIFFTMQALEELVRKNGLFYDVMFFKWEWNLSKIELEDILSADVVAMVKSKIEHMPSILQKALTIASYIRRTFDVSTLLVLIETIHSEIPMDKKKLVQVLDEAVLEGLLLNVVGMDEYTFAHDRIQEASTCFVSGEERNKLCLAIAEGLIKRNAANEVGEDWMLFVGVHHLNSLPDDYHRISDDSKDDSVRTKYTAAQLADLNLQASKAAIVKSAFSQAVELLRAGVHHLNKVPQKWKTEYKLCLDLYNHLLETEYAVGNHVLAQEAVDEVLSQANSIVDKCLAQIFCVEIFIKTRNYLDGIAKGVEFLAEHGVHVTSDPGNSAIMKEKFRLRLAMKNRSLSCMMDLPEIDDYGDAIMWLMYNLCVCSVFVKMKFATFLCILAQRLTWERGINRHVAVMIANLACFTRLDGGKYNESYKLAKASCEMLNRFCDGQAWGRGVQCAHAGVLLVRDSFAGVLDPLLEAYKVCCSGGDIEWGLFAAMFYCQAYICAGFPTNAVFEPKVILFEDESNRLNQPPSVTVTFSIARQFLLNLQGRGNSNPTVLVGSAVDEDKALSQFEGMVRKQTLRDFGIYRIILATVFGDEEAQREMVDRLVPYPDNDINLPRQFLRDIFVGLAALTIGTKRKDKKYLAIGRKKQQIMQKLAKFGSVNVPPVLLCFKAAEKPSLTNYHKAITACAKEGYLHLQAIMNERCGLLLLNQNKDEEEAKRFLTRAMWIFYDWGALGKVAQLRKEHRFLQGSRRSERTPNALLNFVVKHSVLDESTTSDQTNSLTQANSLAA